MVVSRFDCYDRILNPPPGNGHGAGNNDRNGRFVLLEAGSDFGRARGSGGLVRVVAGLGSPGAVNARMIVIRNCSVVGDGGEGP